MAFGSNLTAEEIRGVERADDRDVISGIVHVAQKRCRGAMSTRYGPTDDDLKPLLRWAARGIWRMLFATLAGKGRFRRPQMIDSTHVKGAPPRQAGKRAGQTKVLPVRAAGRRR